MSALQSSMALTILGYFGYHIFQKSVPAGIHPIAAIVVAYGTGLLFGLILLLFSENPIEILRSAKQTNWAVYGIGLAVFIMEIGFLLSYRSGWNMSTGVTVCNVTVILLLIPVGTVFFREMLNVSSVLGIFLCIGGLLLINHI